VFGNLPPSSTVLDAMHKSVDNPKAHGYTNSMGVPAAREAVAKFMQRDGVNYAATDIAITSGASQALLLVVQLLCNPGDSILIPEPGFSLYETICGHLGVTARPYRLLPDRGWECDLAHMDALVDEAAAQGAPVKAVIMNNPGNPTGSNYSRAHLLELQALLARRRLPLVADEIYSYMVFNGETFTPFASLAQDVPVFTISGIAKQFLVPGWRVGWIAIHDPAGRLAALRQPLVSLTQVVLGSCTLVQHALPAILHSLPADYYPSLLATLEAQANKVYDACAAVPGLTCIRPQGAMYVMVRIQLDRFPQFASDAAFAQALLTEENVMVLPGSCFKAHGFFRVVFCAPMPTIDEFAARLTRFCTTHAK
jgi:tyrosine aminotransferase